MKENGLQCLNQKKQKQCLKVERWLTMKGRSTKWIIKKKKKIQLTIAKMKNFPKQ